MEHKFQKGFTLLTLGWSDGYRFIPTGFNLLPSASESNRYNEVSDSIDHRTNGYKVRKASMMHKTDAAIQLIRNALTAGIKAGYVLMDTWFTTEPMLKTFWNGSAETRMTRKVMVNYFSCTVRIPRTWI